MFDSADREIPRYLATSSCEKPRYSLAWRRRSPIALRSPSMSSELVVMMVPLFLAFGPDFPDSVGHVRHALVHAPVPALLHHLLRRELEVEQSFDRGDGGDHPERIKNRLPPRVKNDALRLRLLELSAESRLDLCHRESPLGSGCRGGCNGSHRCVPPQSALDPPTGILPGLCPKI